MNVDLIKRYKDEFDNWLITGKVLVKINTWQLLNHNYIWCHNVPHCIHDEYSELRMAIADGKIVQINDAAKFSDETRTWMDLPRRSLGPAGFLFPVGYYRIKPY